MVKVSKPNSPLAAESHPELKTQLLKHWQAVLARREQIGFPQIPSAVSDWTAIERRVSECGRPQHILVLGIGGSSLGTQVIEECFRNKTGLTGRIFFLESPSPHAWSTLRRMGEAWRDSHVVVISKSGNTLETLSWVERLASDDPRWIEPSRLTVVASPGQGALQNWAKNNGISTLWIPANVGGRFSVLTAAGMFPAALMGLKLEEFRVGAEWAVQHPEIAADLAGEGVRSWEMGLWVTQMWTYSESLRFFGEWWQQLWSESLAKKLDRNGRPAARVSTPMACRGPRDQHSCVQQLIEGTPDKFVFINRIKAQESENESRADEPFKAALFKELPTYGKEISLGQVMNVEALAFERSLVEANIPCATITVDNLNERSLGALFMLWQIATAQLGEYLNIDAFNQPGVELGKWHAHQLFQS